MLRQRRRDRSNYGWRARFLLTLDTPSCTAHVSIRIRLVGTITAAQRSAWETAIEAAWNSRFKLCDRQSCCCTDGFRIQTDIQFVNSGEHQIVNVGADTTNIDPLGRKRHGRRRTRGWPHARSARRVLHRQWRRLGTGSSGHRRDHEQPVQPSRRPDTMNASGKRPMP